MSQAVRPSVTHSYKHLFLGSTEARSATLLSKVLLEGTPSEIRKGVVREDREKLPESQQLTFALSDFGFLSLEMWLRLPHLLHLTVVLHHKSSITFT